MNPPTNLPKLKDPQPGYKWVYRGTGWYSKCANYAWYNKSNYDDWEYATNSGASGLDNTHYCEQVKDEPMTIEEQIVKAKSMIGKTYTRNRVSGVVVTWHVTNTPSMSDHSVLVVEEVERNGICVYVRDERRRQIPVNCEDYLEVAKPEYISLKLNEDYTAKVYKDKLTVGCQTFPISILDDLKALHAQVIVD